MQLNPKGKLARFYMWLPPDNKKLPVDFCTYFWGLIGRGIVVLSMGGFLLFLFIYGIVAGVFFLSAHKMGALLGVLIIAFTILLVWWSERKKKIRIEVLTEARKIVRGKVDAVKKKYCPRIEWK